MVVSVDVDELLMLPLGVLPLIPVEPAVEPLPAVPLFIEPLLVVSLPVVVPLPIDDEPVVPDPVAVPVDRVVLLLFIDPLDVPVDPVVPALGPELVVLLLGEPEAPPWPPLDEPVCASAPPHTMAAAAERARILKVFLMSDS